jgi:16S rRNA G966 N2-methylase RsmD
MTGKWHQKLQQNNTENNRPTFSRVREFLIENNMQEIWLSKFFFWGTAFI